MGRRILFLIIALIVMAARAFPNTVSGGARHTVVVTPDGRVWTWGGNGNGQLGDGTTTDRRTPEALSNITDAVAVAAGGLHTLLLRSDGTVWAWGYNGNGQLGDGTNFTRAQPVFVMSGIVAIAAGENHSLARSGDGRLYAWGSNATGQLGNGSTTSSNQPVLLSLTSVSAIGAGSNHSLAVTADGTAWSWGLNGNGQLGDASTTQRTSPVQMSGISGALAVSGGSVHSLVLLSDGTVKASGNNLSGQLGDGTNTQRTTAVSVTSLANVAAISSGLSSSYALKTDGTVWAWGNNGSGRLGDGTTTNRASAVQVSGPTTIAVLGAGPEFALAVTTDGVVWAWGGNTYGQLGDGTTEARASPITISDTGYAWKVATPVLSVATGTYPTEKSVVITVVTAGATIRYTLDGNDPTESDASIASGNSVIIDQTRTLKARAFKSGVPSGNIAAATYTLAVATVTFSPTPTTYSTAQTVMLSTTSPGVTIRYTTDGSTPTESSPPYVSAIGVSTTTTVKAIGFRTGWTSSSTATGVYTMNFGALAAPTFDPAAGTYTSGAEVTLSAMTGATIRYTTDGTNVTTSSPIYTATLSIATTSTVRAKAFHPDYTASAQSSAAFTIVVATPVLSHTSGPYPAGQVITISTATSGATLRYTLTGATPTASDPIVPATGIVAGNFTLKAVAFKAGCTASPVVTATYEVTGTLAVPRLSAGDAHTLAVRSDGVAWSWGANGSGQLGDGTNTQRTLPVLVGGVSGITVVAAGQNHSLAVRSDGTVWSWGLNGNGQLGDGTTTTRNQPASIAGFGSVVALAGSGSHSFAIKSDGTLWAWGLNSSGQLGDGSTTQRNSPVQVASLAGMTGVSAGTAFSLAVKSDGTIWSWGTNGNGQLGTGNTTSRSSPGPVGSLTTGVAVAAGNAHSVALLANGTVVAWGFNTSGQLGDGSTTQRLSPVAVSGLADIIAIAVGASHSLALAADGTVYAWGANANGQVGDGTTTQRNAPVAVAGLPTIVSIAAGGNQSFAMGTDGTIWAWGRNTNGQLGDGTTTNRLTPTLIANEGMSWKVPTPALSVVSGTYSTAFHVTVTVADASAALHYTTNGASPTEADPTVPSGGTVAVGVSLTLKVRAWKPGAVSSETAAATYELKVVAPVLSPGTGSYTSAQAITISSATSGATLTYTLDGSLPTAESAVYAAPISVSDTRTLKARGFKTGWTPSDSTAASYWIAAGTVATPTITPASGTYAQMFLVTLACTTTGATIRFTLDGTDPTSHSPRYLYPFLIDRTTVVKARAFLPGFTQSAVANASYMLDAAGQTGIPTIVPAGGRFTTQQTVSISGPAGAVLRYTTDGSEPTESSAAVPGGGTLVIDRATALKVRAWAGGATPSAVRRGNFWITGSVAAGRFHSLGLATDGTVWAWGANSQGQLGDGSGTERVAPVAVLTNAAHIAAGQAHSLVAKSDGTVWAWGANSYGQLGDNSPFPHFAPVQVSGLTDVIAVAAGTQHSLALKADGTVWSWGDNTDGQIGDGSSTQRNSPVPVLGLAGVTAIAAGGGFSLAVQGDGAGGGFVFAWGRNTSGQLGEGSITNRPIPVRVLGISTAVDVAAGGAFGMARLADGTVRAWGANDTAQLGNLAGGYSTAPLAVPVLAKITSIAAGVGFGLATDTDGRVWGWGVNTNNQLGTAVEPGAGVGAPQLVPGVTSGVALAGGSLHSLVLHVDGTVWSAGTGSPTGLGSGQHLPLHQIPDFALAANDWLLDDNDADGLVSWEELLAGTDPFNFDTNGNGLSDLIDVRRGAEAARPDDDGDGLPNALEIALGTDPFIADTDGDGVSDAMDGFPLDPTRTDPPVPNPADTTPPTITLTRPTNAVLVGGGGGGM